MVAVLEGVSLDEDVREADEVPDREALTDKEGEVDEDPVPL